MNEMQKAELDAQAESPYGKKHMSADDYALTVTNMLNSEEQSRDEAYQKGVLLFLGRQDWMTDADWEYFQRTGGAPK